jgi:4-diphosphocytidyl-2-C-methyl-D-erythritol kinase
MPRVAIVKSLAKVNLDLRVLHQRGDGYHELRTVFQTISLADTLEIEYWPAQRTALTFDGNVDIPDNLILRAARAALDALNVHARVWFRLDKRIPMGAGLGGGSSNAAAVLLAIPVLAGRSLTMDALLVLAAKLGSDVPYFLTGGTAAGIGRGTELYPLSEVSEDEILVVSPGLHVATGPAYQLLARGLTLRNWSSSISSFQAFVRTLGGERSARVASALSGNDFEAVVFRQHPKLKKILGRLRESGAAGARMTGSGSALFAIYGSKAERDSAQRVLEGDRVFESCSVAPAKLVSRRSYQRLWRRQLRDHLAPHNELWPPLSRYAQ